MKAYCIESVIGNGGGYLGLFLGYSLIQLPNLFKDFAAGLQNKFKRKYGDKLDEKDQMNNNNSYCYHDSSDYKQDKRLKSRTFIVKPLHLVNNE